MADATVLADPVIAFDLRETLAIKRWLEGALSDVEAQIEQIDAQKEREDAKLERRKPTVITAGSDPKSRARRWAIEKAELERAYVKQQYSATLIANWITTALATLDEMLAETRKAN
jgi:hypothetical protein